MASATPEPAEQARMIKALMDRDTVVTGSYWYPLAFKWWQVWCAYVGYDGADPSGESPGPIDNSSLQHPEIPAALKKELALDYDYKLVPAGVWTKLHRWYTGGPEFPRVAVTRGFEASVDLFPHPLKVYLTDETGEPTGEPHVLLVGRSESLATVTSKANTAHSLAHGQSRLWAKPLAEDAKWTLLNPSDRVEDVAGNDEYTDALLEVKVGGKFVRKVPLPPVLDAEGKEIDMDAWRASLVVDSKLDAQDHEKKWYESRVMEIKPETEELNVTGAKHDLSGPGDRLKVHFRGWDHKWDAWYCRSSARLLPLHTKVRNWRDFRATDKVEMKIGTRWHEGAVEEVDREGMRIKLRPTDKVDRKTIGERWFDFDSDDLAESGTHIKRSALAAYYESSSYSSYRSHTKGTPAARGVVGLNNLGNTCFMNSMLQCLSNCELLTTFFLDDRYKAEINKDNVLGCGGHLAEAYGAMLKDMWSNMYSVVCPTEFKKQIGNKAPQFQGYQQQDSQELMSFLMDGLHEDLNRILKKPYVETTESDGRPDEEVALESWDKYKLRNDSIVADIFGGQLRSHVVCNVCEKESTTFDPYLSVSVPLPVKSEKPLIFTYMPYDGAPPRRYKSIVPKTGCIGDVIDWFVKESGFKRTELIVADVYACKVFRFLPDQRPVKEIRDNDIIWMYHVPEGPGADEVKADRARAAEEAAAKRASRHTHQTALTPPDNEQDVVVYMLRVEKPNPYYNPTYGGAATRYEGGADPHLVSVPHCAGGYDKPMTGRQLHHVIFQQLKRFIKAAVLDDYSAEHPPYNLVTIPKSGQGDSKPVPCDDEPVELNPNSLFSADWPQDMVATAFEAEAVTACEMDESTKVDLTRADGMTLAQCFERFSLREQLSKNDMFYCSKCKEHRRAFKKMDLWNVPRVLVVHLKRFQYSQGVYFVHRDKLSNLVEFPLEGLDLSPYVIGPQKDLVYDCFAVSNHAGGLGGGHYTAYAKNFINGEWYDFNDSHVSHADPARIVSRTAYVLFYELASEAAARHSKK